MPVDLKSKTVFLFDIAGTISSIKYVEETLFKYVCDNVEKYLDEHWSDDDLKDIVKDLQECFENVKKIKDEDKEKQIKEIAGVVQKETNEKTNNVTVKKLQGLLYKSGYDANTLKAHIYDDVPSILKSIKAQNKQVAIYSSGSVNSQKLMFENTVAGDLSAYVSKYFDLSVGKKTLTDSYTKIAEQLEVKPDEIVFFTDLIEEAAAAVEAKCASVLVIRSENKPIPDETNVNIQRINGFDDLVLSEIAENGAKRKNEEPIETEESKPSKILKTDDLAEQSTQTGVEKVTTDTQTEKPCLCNVDTSNKATATENSATESMDVDEEKVNGEKKTEVNGTADKVAEEKKEITTEEKTDVKEVNLKADVPVETQMEVDSTEIPSSTVEKPTEHSTDTEVNKTDEDSVKPSAEIKLTEPEVVSTDAAMTEVEKSEILEKDPLAEDVKENELETAEETDGEVKPMETIVEESSQDVKDNAQCEKDSNAKEKDSNVENVTKTESISAESPVSENKSEETKDTGKTETDKLKVGAEQPAKVDEKKLLKTAEKVATTATTESTEIPKPDKVTESTEKNESDKIPVEKVASVESSELETKSTTESTATEKIDKTEIEISSNKSAAEQSTDSTDDSEKLKETKNESEISVENVDEQKKVNGDVVNGTAEVSSSEEKPVANGDSANANGKANGDSAACDSTVENGEGKKEINGEEKIENGAVSEDVIKVKTVESIASNDAQSCDTTLAASAD